MTTKPPNSFPFHPGASGAAGPYRAARNQRREGNPLSLTPPPTVAEHWSEGQLCTAWVPRPELGHANNSQGCGPQELCSQHPSQPPTPSLCVSSGQTRGARGARTGRKCLAVTGIRSRVWWCGHNPPSQGWDYNCRAPPVFPVPSPVRSPEEVLHGGTGDGWVNDARTDDGRMTQGSGEVGRAVRSLLRYSGER